MAAYAAIACLMNTMEQIRNHPRLSDSFDTNQVESLGEHLDFFLGYVESYTLYHGCARKEVKDLERRIASAAHAAEDVIESYVVDQIQGGFMGKSPALSVDLQKILEEMSVIKELVAKAKEEMPHYIKTSTPTTPYIRRDFKMPTRAGFARSLDEIVAYLVGEGESGGVFTITGQADSGKTTLARNAYDSPLIKTHFSCRAWANVSVLGNARGVMLQILSCLGRSTHKLVGLSDDELGRELHRMLSGARYLVVLDDVWMTLFWDRIYCFFPENNNGSRIIVTTRIKVLASVLGKYEYEMPCLDNDESWELFRRRVFGDESCPSELEAIGREIVEYCGGDAFLISALGSFIGRSSRKQEFWEYVAKSIGSISSNTYDFDDRCTKISKFCYDALPTCLKTCYLYMGMFPKFGDIHVSQVIRLWIVEGVLKPSKGHTLEEVGENCILELIDRKLISVSGRGSNGKPKTCKLDNVFGYFSLRVAEKEKFISSMDMVDVAEGRRFNLEKYEDPQLLHYGESSLLARSLICGSQARTPFRSCLLRVLIEVYSDTLEAAFEQVNLQFLAYESIYAPIKWMDRYELPSSISRLWKLQSLIIGKKIQVVVAPSEIWKMRQLRHLHFNMIHLPEPPTSDDDESIWLNLQSLGTVVNLECSEEVCKRMPNIKKLRVFYDDLFEEGQGKYWYCLFTKLESLNCSFCKVPNRDDFLQNLKFPSSLTKLVLQDCELHWSDLSIIGSLPFLEDLKLRCQSVRGPMWETIEGEFVRLKFLEIDSCYLIYWSSDMSHFPALEKLVLRGLNRLKEIPSKIGEIPTLEEIRIIECNISVAISATRILEEREQIDKSKFQVRVSFGQEEELVEFTVKVGLEVIRSPRLHFGVS